MKRFAVRLNAETYPVEPIEREALARIGIDLKAIEGQAPDEIVEAARECEALLVVSSRVPAAVIEELCNCRVISRLGAGTDKIDVAAATRCGIVVANVPDFCVNEQAEHTFALLLAWTRRLPDMLDAMRHARWTARNDARVHRLAGQTLGLVGFGASAQAVARRAAAFGLHVTAWARNPAKCETNARGLNVRLTTLEEVLRDSDFVSLHLPLTYETRGIVDGNHLDRMKPTAVLINTARGALIDEAALVDRLRRGRVAGALLDTFDGIDVFARPGTQSPHPFFDLDNVLMTPHCAGSSVESAIESKARGAQHAVDVLSDRWPPHVVNPGVVPRRALAPADQVD